jgi:hypothetical protein
VRFFLILGHAESHKRAGYQQEQRKRFLQKLFILRSEIHGKLLAIKVLVLSCDRTKRNVSTTAHFKWPGYTVSYDDVADRAGGGPGGDHCLAEENSKFA